MEDGIQRIEIVMGICNDYKDSPADIIADLIHWCKKHNLNWDEVVRKAENYVEADIEEI